MSGRPHTADFLIIGGGIIGVSLSLELTRRYPGASIALIEKEQKLGTHGSGRNSGVLHAGFYYSADSLKARFTREGNQRLTEYCTERKLQLNACGKLVVARNESDLAGLDELLRRGQANQVELSEVTEREAVELEPLAKTYGRALWSPTTSSVDPTEVMRSLVADAMRARVSIISGTKYMRRNRDGTVATSSGAMSAGYVVNAAGLQADRVAHDFGFGHRYRILPFKGLYLYGSGATQLRRHVYPVPNLGNPFLGVHFTVTVDRHTKIGPTAIPAFWREQYAGLSRFRPSEFVEVLWRETQLFLRNDFGFRSLAFAELRKYRRQWLVTLAAELVPTASPAEFRRWGRPGIRAQLFDTTSRTLEMDFVYEGDDRSFHVLNAVSPAFTCALPFSEHLGAEIARRVV
jgi:(S)-2-hydroxyglutarate dehydrogenase